MVTIRKASVSFPKQSLVYGPKQIANRINQDTEVSRQLTLWNQAGSRVIQGELLVIPIEESLIYVQPIYLRAEGGNIPELKRVVVAHENQVVMRESLEEGLNALFAPAPRDSSVPRARFTAAAGAEPTVAVARPAPTPRRCSLGRRRRAAAPGAGALRSRDCRATPLANWAE